MWVPIRDQLANVRQSGRDFIFRNHFAVYADSFAKRDQMRGDEEAGPVFLGATDRIDHGADRALAVGAGDVNHPRVRKIDIQLANQPLDIFEAEFNAEALKAVEPGERLSVFNRWSRHSGPSHIHETEEK